MATLILNKQNFFAVLYKLMPKLKRGEEFEIRLIKKRKELRVKPEVERSWYRDPDNPKRFDYDVVDKVFESADEAIKFLRDLYQD